MGVTTQVPPSSQKTKNLMALRVSFYAISSIEMLCYSSGMDGRSVATRQVVRSATCVVMCRMLQREGDRERDMKAVRC